MERNESTAQFINLMLQPAFAVKDGIIELVNDAARGYALEAGQSISEMLVTGVEEYRELQKGCLYLTLSVSGVRCGASVRRMPECDVFTLEQEADEAELQAMALAAQELRVPLSNVMTIADQLFPVVDSADNPVVQEQTSRINRGLYQILRIISNMSDAYRYTQQTEHRQSLVELTSFMQETFEKATEMLRKANVELRFENLNRPVQTFADLEKLERAIHNILSNAVKFSAKGSAIEATLNRRNQMLYLTVQDKGDGVVPVAQGNLHARFRRKPGLEDNRFGIGLGTVLIRSAASVHGGTVLIDHPNGYDTRITMSIAIRNRSDHILRASTLSVDYAGEHDHPLMELSEVLPAELYRSDRIY